MITKITDIYGNTKEIKCIACSIQSGSMETPAGVVFESEHFRLEQDVEIPIKNFLVLVSKRHYYGFDEMTNEEVADFGLTLKSIRKTLREVFSIEHVHYILEENTSSSHFHLWIFPRYDWMNEKFGSKIDSVRPIMEFARKEMKTSQNLADIEENVNNLRQALQK